MVLSMFLEVMALHAEQAAPLISFDILPSNRPPGVTPDKIEEDNPTDGFERSATAAQRKAAKLKLEIAIKRAMRQGSTPTVVHTTPQAPRGGI